MNHIHDSLEVMCRRKGCLEAVNLHKLTEHEEQCKTKRGSSKSNLRKLFSNKNHKDRAVSRVLEINKKVSELSEKADEDVIDVLFTLLALKLDENEIKLKDNVENLHEIYVSNIHNVEDHYRHKDKMSVEESTVMKVYTNMTSQNVVKTQQKRK